MFTWKGILESRRGGLGHDTKEGRWQVVPLTVGESQPIPGAELTPDLVTKGQGQPLLGATAVSGVRAGRLDRQSGVNIQKEQRSQEEYAGIRRMWPELAMPTTVPAPRPSTATV